MDDDGLARLLTEWGLLKESDIGEARALQARLKLAGGSPSLEKVLVEFGFLTRRQLDDALAVTEGLPVPGEELPLDVAEAMHRPEAKFGHFLLLSEIGRGGLGVVHRAWDSETRMVVALKFLRSEASLDPERVMELILEGSRLSRLRHPNIINVYEFGQVRGQFYIAMDLLEGMGLDQLLKSARARGQISPFYSDPKRYLAIIRDVARAAHYAHTRTPPLIHCDLKPHNIFVDLSWRPYLVDFGLARELRTGAGGAEDGTVKGSPSYMAPEQVLGRTAEIDVRTDVYGLGAILYELLSGRPPYAGELTEVLDKNLLVDPPPPSKVVATRVAISTSAGPKPTVPPEVEAICLRCIAREKKDRFQSAREVAEAIDPLVGDRPLRVKTTEIPAVVVAAAASAPVPPSPKTSRKEVTRRALTSKAIRRSMTIGFLGGVLLVAVVVVLVLRLATGGDEVLDIQRRTVQAKADALASVLDVEDAREQYAEYGSIAVDPKTAEWVAARQEELEWLRQFRDQLIAALDRERPAVSSFKLRAGPTFDGRITGASLVRVALFTAGEEKVVAWAEIHPDSILGLARRASKEFGGKGPLGMAVYAMKNRLWVEARDMLRKIEDPAARKLEGNLPAP